MTKVLLVDDDVDFVEMNKVLLENNGYSVISAHNGEDGKKKAAAEKPDIIILDVMMTTRNEGFNVARDLRNSEATKNIPIIMLTSINQEVPWKFGPDDVWLPVDEFVEKPVKPDRILQTIKKIISK